MINRICFTLVLALTNIFACAQTDSTYTYRKAYHYIGVQANQLAKQLLNTSGSSTIDNPYLLVYAVNSSTYGHGLNVGWGYTYNQAQDGDTFNKRETTINNLFFRVGYEKKSKLGKKWIASWGFDMITENLKNKTKNTIDFGQGKTITTTVTKSNATGIGPRLTLNYKITDDIIIGTEASYYLKSGTTSFSTETSGNTVKNSEDFKKVQFAVPAVLFLIVRL